MKGEGEDGGVNGANAEQEGCREGGDRFNYDKCNGSISTANGNRKHSNTFIDRGGSKEEKEEEEEPVDDEPGKEKDY